MLGFGMLGLGLTPLVAAAPAPAPFLDLSLDAALARAAAEKKLVLLDFYTTWCGPCKVMDRTTWQDPQVLALLQARLVAVKLDGDRNHDLEQRFGVSAYPTVVLLKPDGTVLDRMVGIQAADELRLHLDLALAGKSVPPPPAPAAKGLARGPEATLATPPPPQQAEALLGQGKQAEALAVLLKAYDEALITAPLARQPSYTLAILMLDRLASEYPPAREALQARREAAKQRFLAAPGDPQACQWLADLNVYLRDPDATLALFDSLPPDAPGRASLGPHLFQVFTRKQRYAEAVRHHPLERIRKVVDQYGQSLKTMDPGSHHELMIRRARRIYAAEGVEALAGAGLTGDAKTLAREILDLDPGPDTRLQLEKHLARSGRPFPLD